MAKFGRYDSSNQKKSKKKFDKFKKIKDSEKGFSRSNDKIYLKNMAQQLKDNE